MRAIKMCGKPEEILPPRNTGLSGSETRGLLSDVRSCGSSRIMACLRMIWESAVAPHCLTTDGDEYTPDTSESNHRLFFTECLSMLRATGVFCLIA